MGQKKPNTCGTREWVVTKFDLNTLVGVVRFGTAEHTFHSTSFQSDTALRFPRVGEKVELVMNAAGALLSVHGK